MFWDILFSNIKFTFDFIDHDIEMTAIRYEPPRGKTNDVVF